MSETSVTSLQPHLTQMKKLNAREAEQFAQEHMANKLGAGRSQRLFCVLNPGYCMDGLGNRKFAHCFKICRGDAGGGEQ